jgi:dTDP-4-dehydrorhamnose reductase
VANRIREAARSGGEISSDNSQIGNPTWVEDVANTVCQILSNGHSGVFNCVSGPPARRFEYVSEIVRLSGLAVKVKPVDASNFNRVARVSHNESAENVNLERLKIVMPCWKESLAKYIRSLDIPGVISCGR